MNNDTKTIFMRKADWEKWDAALRSGEFKQGYDHLYDKNNNGYCCLGVMQMALTGTVEQSDGHSYCLPTDPWLDEKIINFKDSRQINTNNPVVYYDSIWAKLSTLNDIYKLSFTEIADLIKNHVQFTD